MHRAPRALAGLVALGLLVSGCYGPFNLTRRLHLWNGNVQDKWGREVLFLVLAWVPYGLTVLGDAVVFNSMEFWTGDNPVDPPRSEGPRTKHLVRGSDEALLTFASTPQGAQLIIEQFQDSQPAASLRIEQYDGMTIGRDADDRLLFTAQTTADGGVIVFDGDGQEVASYSGTEAERLLATTTRFAAQHLSQWEFERP